MAIQITETALKKIKEGMSSSNLDPRTTFLRMGVKGGGCSGLSYLLEFAADPQDGDKVFTFSFPDAEESDPKLKVAVDKRSYLYLNAVTLEYVTEGLTGGFTFINPNAKSSCGCGQSFST